MRTSFIGEQLLKAVVARANTFLLAAIAMIALSSVAYAAEGSGQPVPWQVGFQEPVTAIARQIESLHNFLMVVITLVTLFVVGLLVYIVVKFNEKANPVPSTTSHHTLLEVVWTTVPILILLIIVVPSFRLLFDQYDFPKADVVIKVTGNQWNWTYEYRKQGGLSFDARMLSDEEVKQINDPNKAPRILAVNNYMVVPVNKNVEMLVTASDVIHAWAVPAFGVKADAVPGRVVRTWFNAEKIGTYYGQCSELCGKDHAFMPIGVKVVSQEDYQAWLVKTKKDIAAVKPARKTRQGTRLAVVQGQTNR